MENRRKELEIKVEIVSKMDETIMHQIDKALSLTSKKPKRPTEVEQNSEFEYIKNWYSLEAKRIESKLNTYFPETTLDNRWDTYARTLNQFIIALLVYLSESDPQNVAKPYSDKRIEYIKSTGNKKYEEDGLVETLASNFNTGTDLVSDVIAMFSEEGGNIKKDIMKLQGFLDAS